MGFLTSLGEFAGGVSEGISKEAVDRARREQAKAARTEREAKERLEAQDITMAKLTAAEAGREYVPPAAKEKPTISGDFKNAAGVLAKLFGKKEVEQDAIVSGVKPPPPVLGVDTKGRPVPAPVAAPAPVATTPAPVARVPVEEPLTPIEPLGPRPVGLGVPPPAAAAATGAPQQVKAEVLLSPEPIKEDPAPKGYDHPEKVPDRHGEPGDMRSATPIDKQYRLAMNLAQAGKWKEANEANDKYTQMVAQKTVGNVPYMTLGELSQSLSKTLKRDVRATRADDGRYTLTDWSDPKAPEILMKDETVGHVQQVFANELGLDATLRAALATDSDHNFQEVLKARGAADVQSATAANLRATTGETVVDTATKKTAAQTAADWQGKLVEYTPAFSMVRDPAGFRAWAQMGGLTDNKSFMSADQATGPEGETVKKYINTQLARVASEEAAFFKHPVAQANLVQVAMDENGRPEFVVIDKDGKIPKGGRFGTDGGAALAAAERAVKDGAYGTTDLNQIVAGIAKARGVPATRPLGSTAPTGGPAPAAAAGPPAAKRPPSLTELPRVNPRLAGLVPGGRLVAGAINAAAGGAETVANAPRLAVSGAEDAVTAELAGGRQTAIGVEVPGLEGFASRHYVQTHSDDYPKYKAKVNNPKGHSARELRVAQKMVDRYEDAVANGWTKPKPKAK